MSLLLLVYGSLLYGSTMEFGTSELLRGLSFVLGLEESSDQTSEAILILRLRRTFVALGVGAALSYSGVLLQGIFRNGLASPSVLGISTGASVGASVGILIVAGYGPSMVVSSAVERAPLFVTTLSFVGAFLTTLLVSALGTRSGRISVPTLLLAGIAVNTCLGAFLVAMQSFAMSDNLEVAKALVSWTFGSLEDHGNARIAVVWCGLGIAMGVLPFVARELDLFASGEEDAAALGVNTTRVKFMALGAASLAAASAVAVAGQIAFLGLVVPHLLRMWVGNSHKRLLPLSLLAGAAFLLAADLGQRMLLGHASLRPGVLMSLVGGPFFLFLLMRSRKELRTW
ncbi:MAG: iron complex transport system permease protein [Planctomycetota bacterium]|jgi:iron complex transport system permease protein